ncbi:MAG: hypothetical protein P8013_06990 [Candidatus Sulfobium sp.]|jgi:hypothetical protein
MMKIDCYLSQKCGAEAALRENIRKALTREDMEAEVSFHRLSDVEASLKGLKGSPAIFVNGREVQPRELTGFT